MSSAVEKESVRPCVTSGLGDRGMYAGPVEWWDWQQYSGVEKLVGGKSWNAIFVSCVCV